jgi:hypothetical protein
MVLNRRSDFHSLRLKVRCFLLGLQVMTLHGEISVSGKSTGALSLWLFQLAELHEFSSAFFP